MCDPYIVCKSQSFISKFSSTVVRFLRVCRGSQDQEYHFKAFWNSHLQQMFHAYLLLQMQSIHLLQMFSTTLMTFWNSIRDSSWLLLECSAVKAHIVCKNLLRVIVSLLRFSSTENVPYLSPTTMWSIDLLQIYSTMILERYICDNLWLFCRSTVRF